jgi:AcrR family transcriptional regulator
MARWEPNARERLEKAALELYRERGFDETAVADIAARAGLTERTFFRYFVDKREVLFGGSPALRDLLTERIAGASDSMKPMDSVLAALEATSAFFEERRAFAKARQTVIADNAALRERELIKLASLASAIAGALRARGVPDPAASLAAEAGIAVFKLAFERWVKDKKKRDLVHHLREADEQLRALTAGEERRRPAARLDKGRVAPHEPGTHAGLGARMTSRRGQRLGAQPHQRANRKGT